MTSVKFCVFFEWMVIYVHKINNILFCCMNYIITLISNIIIKMTHVSIYYLEKKGFLFKKIFFRKTIYYLDKKNY